MKKEIFIYDGSYQGLLTALYTAFKRKIMPVKIVKAADFREDLFYKKTIIKSSEEKAALLMENIKEHISSASLKNVFAAYLSEIESIEDYIFRYLFLGFKKGEKIDEFLSTTAVIKVQEAAKKVRRESHRFKGLIRFREAQGNKYYGAVEPDHDILILLAPHFKDRFSIQDWLIHDKKREKAVIYSAESGEWLLIELEADFEPQYSEQEDMVQDLWKSFFSAVSIKNRYNPKLQSQFMPKKYWGYLVEKPGSSRDSNK
ncbi:TIGR03915 family putative DNA repair protein [Halanaerobium hydrogeniformans]|uniref:DUF4130 domain-containing protein n=1 Tax=Halanaerobium hydrogeniformans TaxID=656519 RepID=E4RN26_HALHG|nr:TIGR03915 family putative DNA repair protein [Halanaerobium hydrogeniformans]ADQ14243.1 hypothetical protein Halsa_0796 [Halanaerobium hydrogeniformans]